MAINSTAYDWSVNNFGLAEWDDISFSFDTLGTGQFFDSYIADNFTPYDVNDDFSFTPVSASTSPSLSSVASGSSLVYTDVTAGSASYSEINISSPSFSDIVIAGES